MIQLGIFIDQLQENIKLLFDKVSEEAKICCVALKIRLSSYVNCPGFQCRELRGVLIERFASHRYYLTLEGQLGEI